MIQLGTKRAEQKSPTQQWRSVVCTGRVQHTRLSPKKHHFSYRLSMMLFDLAEMPSLFSQRRFWSLERFNLASFYRADHLRGGDADLESAARDRVEAFTGRRPTGRISLLTQPRYFGYGFNPISLFFCNAKDSDCIETVMLEVHNTPWGEQQVYVLPLTKPADLNELIDMRFDKAMHVSPFMPMNLVYQLRIKQQQDRLGIALQCHKDDELIFRAGMNLDKRLATARNMNRILWSYPLMTLHIVCAIHWQALRLWLKGIKFIPHPKHNPKTTAVTHE